jgi:hypothetical protein
MNAKVIVVFKISYLGHYAKKKELQNNNIFEDIYMFASYETQNTSIPMFFFCWFDINTKVVIDVHRSREISSSLHEMYCFKCTSYWQQNNKVVGFKL